MADRGPDFHLKARDVTFLHSLLGCLLEDIEGGHAEKCKKAAGGAEYDTLECELCDDLQLAADILETRKETGGA